MPSHLIDDAEINYMVEGKGPWLVMLHGFGSSLLDWEDHRPILAENFSVLTIDFRGFGLSTRTGPYTIKQFSSDVIALMDHLSIGSAGLMGYSMGGAVAFQLVLDHPDRFSRLMLVNTWDSFKPTTFRRRRETIMRKLVVRFLSMEFMAKILGKRLFHKPGQEALRAQFIERYGANSSEVYLALLKSLPRWGVTERLEEITLPVLVQNAQYDYTPLSEKEAFVSAMPAATLEVVDDMGHCSPFEDIDLFCDRIVEFFLTDTKN
jgi:3-oxoadipate enol-lactonase